MAKVLEVHELAKSFGGVQAVKDLSFDLAEGQLLAMIGPNGAGKSTCFNLINGQLRPDYGRVVIMGKKINGYKPRQVWKLGVGRTFQITSTFASMTVLELAAICSPASLSIGVVDTAWVLGWLTGLLQPKRKTIMKMK